MLTYLSDAAQAQGWVSVNVSALPGMLEEIVQQAHAASAHLIDTSTSAKLASLKLGDIAEVQFSDSLEAAPTWRIRMGELLDALAETDTGLLITVDEVRERCLSRAALPQYRELLPIGDRKGHLTQNTVLRFIRERELFDRDLERSVERRRGEECRIRICEQPPFVHALKRFAMLEGVFEELRERSDHFNERKETERHRNDPIGRSPWCAAEALKGPPDQDKDDAEQEHLDEQQTQTIVMRDGLLPRIQAIKLFHELASDLSPTTCDSDITRAEHLVGHLCVQRSTRAVVSLDARTIEHNGKSGNDDAQQKKRDEREQQ